jgi:hypothetical protein
VNPSEFVDVLRRVLARLKGPKKSRIISVGERRGLRSVVAAWFSEYRDGFAQAFGEEERILRMDGMMQAVLKLASKESARVTIVRMISKSLDYFTENLLVALSRAYWSRAPERTPAGRDGETGKRLKQLDPDLADGYEQAVIDIEEIDRLSYRGPAAELREVLTGVLHQLAPNEEVEKTDWYKEARKSGARREPTPTRAERTKFILRSRGKGSAVTESDESFMTSVEERLASVVNAAYKRGSAATHGGTERDELLNLLPYVNALLRELLPPLKN